MEISLENTTLTSEYGVSNSKLNPTRDILGVSAIPAVFGSGFDGNLYIPAGVTLTIDASTKDFEYDRIQIESGGTLRVIGSTTAAILRAKTLAVINGTIDASEVRDVYTATPYSLTTKWGTVASGTSGQGGKGGKYGAIGANGDQGCGSGGSGGVARMGGADYQGGDGHVGGFIVGAGGTATTTTAANTTITGNNAAGLSAGGAGTIVTVGFTGTITSGAGGGSSLPVNASVSGSAGQAVAGGGGGRGGHVGKFGLNLQLYLNNLSGNGTVKTDGGVGENGKDGSNGATYGAVPNDNGYGGSGGGGGGGGGAGYAYMEFIGTNALTFSNAAGIGGSGGNPGTPNSPAFYGTSGPGSNSTAGNTFTKDIS